MSKNYNAKRDANPSQICKVHGNGVFLEVIQPNDTFERVTINLVSLNPNNTQKCIISTYVDVPDFITLCQRIACGRFGQMIERGKAIARQSNSFPAEIWKRQGGKPGPNNAWMLTIHPATKSDCIFKAVRGTGEQMQNGLIKLKYSNTNDQVMVPLTHELLENIANISLMRIQAYITSRQMRGLYDYVPRTHAGEPEYRNEDFVEQQPVDAVQQVQQAVPVQQAQAPVQQIVDGPVDFI